MSSPPRRQWLTPLLVFIAIVQVLVYLRRQHEPFAGGKLSSLLYPGQELKKIHPITTLITEAEIKYATLLHRQSKSLKQAAQEYQRRYGRPPPKGFDEWYQFATDNGVKIIDEYDSLVEDLKPFWNLTGKELRSRALQAGMLPSIQLVRIEDGKSRIVQAAVFKDQEEKARARGFEAMIKKFIKKLPNMDIPINAKAEGRVLVSWEHRLFPDSAEQDSTKGARAMLGGEFLPDWRNDGSVWESYRRTCAPNSEARRLFAATRSQLKHGKLPHNHMKNIQALNPEDVPETQFAEGTDQEFDFCNKPWAHHKQGHFFSDWRTIPVYYPIFSPAKTRGYGDILIPSHYYYSSTIRYTYGWDPQNAKIKARADGETPWEEKTNSIYWRGATTGGGSTPPGHSPDYQRHRFIRKAAPDAPGTTSVTFAWPPTSKTQFKVVDVPVADLNSELIDAAFTKAVGCEQYPGGCTAIQQDYRFEDPVPLGAHWRHKYLVDFDGMGYSARLFALLASDSAVIKSTVYREFFSDWIQPWLHFIPLSMSYDEIYNIHAYFSGPSNSMMKAANVTLSPKLRQAENIFPGDVALRKIAQAGKTWKNTIGRKVDMEAYVYRLCLEYARLWADDREAWTYKNFTD